MANEWIREAIQRFASERLAARHGQTRHDLVEHRATKKAADSFVVARFAHRLEPGEQRNRNDNRVRSVEQANFSLPEWRNVASDHDPAIAAIATGEPIR
jgi:hypothetical protein